MDLFKVRKNQNTIVVAFLIVVILDQTQHIVTAKEHMAIDPSKCNLPYIRKLVYESCIRPNPNKRMHKRHIRDNEQIDAFPFELLPPDHTMKITRKKRGNEFQLYFNYCCENMHLCETQMPCV